VAPNLRLFMKYNPEELMALRQSNQDAFDLFASIMMDQADEIKKGQLINANGLILVISYQ
jgi:hypothetical protein